jgi:YidC/Oxa1 family membrane protein insertase
MDNKPIQNILKNALTFLIIFLIVNFIFNSLFSNKESQTPPTGIIFKTVSSSYAMRENVIVDIENYTNQDLTVKNNCPKQPLQVQYFENNTWVNKEFAANLNCDGTGDLIIKPGEKNKIAFNSWSYELFKNKGNYKILLPLADKTLESNQFEIKDPSFFHWLWQTALYQPIYNALILFVSFFPHDLGLSIIILTIIIRTLLLLPNQKALRSQKKLQELQPKIASLKEKHGNDKEKIALETMSLYKEHKVNPFGSCLPILIQLPILIALFYVIQTGLDVSNQYLLYGPLQNFDITIINTNFLGILELTKINFIALPIIVGALQYLQMRMSLARKKKKADQKPASSEMDIANRTMTVTMPLMIAVFTASVPAGVGLYWAFSTIYGIGQQYVINNQGSSQETKIRVINASKNQQKKEHYQQLNEQRKSENENDTEKN